MRLKYVTTAQVGPSFWKLPMIIDLWVTYMAGIYDMVHLVIVDLFNIALASKLQE
jgi:hypothetical protein